MGFRCLTCVFGRSITGSFGQVLIVERRTHRRERLMIQLWRPISVRSLIVEHAILAARDATAYLSPLEIDLVQHKIAH